MKSLSVQRLAGYSPRSAQTNTDVRCGLYSSDHTAGDRVSPGLPLSRFAVAHRKANNCPPSSETSHEVTTARSSHSHAHGLSATDPAKPVERFFHESGPPPSDSRLVVRRTPD